MVFPSDSGSSAFNVVVEAVGIQIGAVAAYDSVFAPRDASLSLTLIASVMCKSWTTFEFFLSFPMLLLLLSFLSSSSCFSLDLLCFYFLLRKCVGVAAAAGYKSF